VLNEVIWLESATAPPEPLPEDVDDAVVSLYEEKEDVEP
jgi:hypothetical protein